jgi:hypothetical protein
MFPTVPRKGYQGLAKNETIAVPAGRGKVGAGYSLLKPY